MKKFLSVLLAVMMVVSTVSFAAPSAVTVADSATNAVVENTIEETTEIEEANLLADDTWYDLDLGDKLFVIDLDGDTKYQTAALANLNNRIDGTNDNVASNGLYLAAIGRTNPKYAEYEYSFKYSFKDGGTPVVEGTDDKYFKHTSGSQASVMVANPFVGAGTYTLVFNHNANVTFKAHSGYMDGTLSTTAIDSSWAQTSYTVDISAQGDDYFRIYANTAPGTYTIDDVALFYMPEGWTPPSEEGGDEPDEPVGSEWEDATHGTKLFTVDFTTKNDGTAVTAADVSTFSNGRLDGSASAGVAVSGVGRINPSCTYDAFRVGAKDATAVSLVDGSVTATGTRDISFYFRDTYVGPGTYTYVFDYNTASGRTFSLNSGYNTKGTLTTKAVDATHTRVTYVVTGVNDSNYITTDTYKSNYLRFYPSGASAEGKFVFDNIAVYFKPEGKLDLTIAGNVYKVNAGTYTASELVELVKANIPTCVGFALTTDGEVISGDETIDIKFNTTLYAVLGFDVTLKAGDNAEFSDVTLTGFNSKDGVTVGELVSKIDVSSSNRPLLGLSYTADGEVLAESTVVKSSALLYMIWGAEVLVDSWTHDEYGTRLFVIDFEKDNEGNALTSSEYTAITSGSVYSNPAASGVFAREVGRVNPELGSDYDDFFKFGIRGPSSVSEGTDGTNKYLTTPSAETSVIVHWIYLAQGTYTLVFDYNTDCGTRFQRHSGYEGGTYKEETISADRTRVIYSVEATSSNYIRIISKAAAVFNIDNVALYYKSTGDVQVTIESGKESVQDKTVSVDAETGITAGQLKEQMGCFGIALTPDGEILSDDTVIKSMFDKTVYAVWSMDVTLKANDNADFSDVTISGIDEREGITVRELLSKINNTTGRGVRGISESANGAALSLDTVINGTKTLYILWTVDESTLGTLIFNIDFEKEGIEAPVADSSVDVNKLTDVYNPDLVPDGIKLILNRIGASSLVTENGNTYFASSNSSSDRSKINIAEYQTGDFSWTYGTYTIVADVKFDGSVKVHNDAMTTIDDVMNIEGEWDRVTYEFVGVVSSSFNDSGESYGSLVMGFETEAGISFALDNLKIYYKTDATTITIKNGGNDDIGDVVAENVSTTEGITVGELIELVKKEDTNRVLLGISETPTGELLDESTVITPKYPIVLYTQWKTRTNNPYVDDKLGKMLFEVDFENEAVINANWAGYAELDNKTNATAGERITKIASYYDPMLEGKNVRLLVRLNTSDYSQVGIKTAADGNHYIEGVINTSNPKVQILNNASLALENGVYTLYLDGIATGDGSVSHQKFDPYTVTYVEGDANSDGKFDYTPAAWTTYGLSFGINDGGKIPSGQVHYNIPTGNTVAYDNVKLYYKPYKATITLLHGEYEAFGTRTLENVDTFGAVTGQYLVDQIQADLDVCGREFIGLMDEYGDMINLDKALIIPCDMTYTIVWGEADERAPETIKKNSIRISTNEHSGIRFAANAKKIYTTDENTTQYGWLVVSAEKLAAKGVAPTSLTKETGAKHGINVKEGYSYKKGEIDDPIIFLQDDEEIMMTLVVYNIQAKDYAKEICVRPFIVIDGVTYYGTPFKRSIYEVAKELQGEYTHGDASDDLNGRAEQDYIDYIDNIVNTVEGTN